GCLGWTYPRHARARVAETRRWLGPGGHLHRRGPGTGRGARSVMIRKQSKDAWARAVRRTRRSTDPEPLPTAGRVSHGIQEGGMSTSTESGLILPRYRRDPEGTHPP